jgi:DNA mismatch endonuclease (patch repair protein)
VLGYAASPPSFAATRDVDAILPLRWLAAADHNVDFWQAQQKTNTELASSGLYITNLFRELEITLIHCVKDRLSKERRSWNMSRIRGKDTMPEKIVRSLLHRMGYRFRLHVRIPVEVGTSRCGVPPAQSGRSGARLHAARTPQRSVPAIRAVSVDILLPKHKTAIFVHGCFWHRHRGCKNCTTPTNRHEWWVAKLEGNAARSKVHQAAAQETRLLIMDWEMKQGMRKLRYAPLRFSSNI